MKGKWWQVPPLFHLPERWILAGKKLRYYFGLSITVAGILVGGWGFLVLFFKPGTLFQLDKFIALSRLLAGALAVGAGSRLLLSSQHYSSNRLFDDALGDYESSINTGGGNYNEFISGNYNEFISGNYNEFISGDYIEGDYISIQGDYINMNSDISEIAVQLLEIVTRLESQGRSKEEAQQVIAKDLGNQARRNRAVRVKLRKWRCYLDNNFLTETPVLEVAKAVIGAASVPDTLPDDLYFPLSTKYSRLEGLLKEKKWREADRETALIVVREFKEEEFEELSIGEIIGCIDYGEVSDWIETFPGDELRHINNLWLKYSEGRFGFSVQKDIWRTVGKDYDTFGDCVGWRVEGDWICYSDVTYSLRAPLGHLPITVMMLDNFYFSNSCEDAESALEAFISRQYKRY